MDHSSSDFIYSEALPSNPKKKTKTERKNDMDADKNIDRLSDLPENIIHHIMSFLPTEDATLMSALSKSLSSSWRSFPILDFDFYLIKSVSRFVFTMDMFLILVTETLERRALKSDLQRLSFRACLKYREGNFKIVLKKMVSFAIQNNVKELFLYFVDSRVYGLPKAVFSTTSIKRMLLQGLMLKHKKLVLRCPLIEDFSIINCTSMGKIAMNVCSPKLKTAKFENWIGLERIQIDGAASLESFSYTGDVKGHRCEIVNLGSCKSLKTLKLIAAHVTDEWFEEQVFQLVLLETLKLSHCNGLTTLCIHNESLKIMDLQCCDALEKVDVFALNLEVFRYVKNRSAITGQCKINLTKCVCLKDLQLTGANSANVTDEWSDNKICRIGFPFLENLKLEGCNLLKDIRFYSEHLKRLELLHCDGLREAEIDSPNLVSLVYHGPLLSSSPVISSNIQNTELHLNHQDIQGSNHFYKRLRNLISIFCHSKTLSLVCYDYQELIFPSEQRKKLVSPLFDLRHLNIKLKNEIKSMVDLIDGLLWLAPHPMTVSITVASKVHATFKFYYYPNLKLKGGDDGKSMFCCKFFPIKCWRHYVKRVEMEIFERFDERAPLRRYFVENAKPQITTCIKEIYYP